MGDSVRLFSIRSNDYAQFRPSYPDSLFDWLAEQCRQTRYALDVAAGTGQATLPLLARFDRVVACDASSDQLTGSSGWRSVQRFAAQAERLPLRDGLADLLVVAQALHWFATPTFFAEAKRVLAPDGLFCAWCYSLLQIDPMLDAVITRLHGETLKGYWPRGRASVDAGYSDIQAPFETIEPPQFAIETHWNLPQLLGYLRTWSAVRQWQQTNGRDPVAQLEPELARLWGDPAGQRRIRWPLHFLTGYPGR
ncbi:MAG TPA: class I SAM-dependent methyltransferase [Pseudomonas sp.]|nr:class I SAM-dependent methyltransferase [Pseudomonas sp.]